MTEQCALYFILSQKASGSKMVDTGIAVCSLEELMQHMGRASIQLWEPEYESEDDNYFI